MTAADVLAIYEWNRSWSLPVGETIAIVIGLPIVSTMIVVTSMMIVDRARRFAARMRARREQARRVPRAQVIS